MNLVLAETEEMRPKTKQKRTLGLVVLRGEEIVSITVIQGPQQDRSERERILKLTSGGGVVRPVMRGSVVRKCLSSHYTRE